MVKLSHGIDVSKLTKILQRVELKSEDSVSYVNVKFEKEASCGRMRTYEDGRIIYRATTNRFAKIRADSYLKWLKKKGFIILDEKPEVISL